MDFDLLRACHDGNAFKVRRVLDSGRVHVDCMDEQVTILNFSVALNRNVLYYTIY